MARLIGQELDTALADRLSGQDLDRVAGHVVVAMSVDEAGWPHPALLSYLELVAKDRRTLRIATFRGTTLARAARRAGKVTLVIFDDRVSCYIKGTVSELAPVMVSAPESAKLNVAVEQVLTDDPDPRFGADAFVVGPVRYHEPNPDAARARAVHVLAELLE
jgi:hypothetical protein